MNRLSPYHILARDDIDHNRTDGRRIEHTAKRRQKSRDQYDGNAQRILISQHANRKHQAPLKDINRHNDPFAIAFVHDTAAKGR